MSSSIRPQAQGFTSWRTRKHSLWSKSVRKSVFITMVLSCLKRLTDQFLYPAIRSEVFTCVAGIALLTCLVVGVMYCRKKDLTTTNLIVFLTIGQLYAVSIGVFSYPDGLPLLSVASTLVFCVYEIQVVQHRLVLLLLFSRQFAMWHLAFSYTHGELQFPYGIAVFGLGLVLLTLEETRERGLEVDRFYDSIQKEEKKIRAILEAIPEALLVVTDRLDVAIWNEKIVTDIGLEDTSKIASALGRLHCLLDVDSSERLASSLLTQISQFLCDPQSDFATFGLTPISGKFFEWKGTKCEWDEATACIVTASDYSSWVNSQTQLKQESSSKTALLRFVSHELRTPANAILNLATNVMEARNLTEEQKMELSIVVTSTHFLLSVVNDLLDFTRMIADKFTLVKQSFNLRTLIIETVKLIEIQCMHKGLNLKSNVDELIPELVYSDPTRIKQVILNLLGNALKFTFHGGIRLICTHTNANTVKVTVKDTGLGIPKDKIAGLCQVFGTVEGTQRINPQGCGLGLYISNLLALSLGSKPIDIKSRVGIGSEFSFEVNIYQEDACSDPVETIMSTIEDERDIEQTVSSSNMLGGNGFRCVNAPDILVVDDSAFNRLVLLKMLEMLNFRADEAPTGLRAISAIKENIKRGHYYRLIFMDVEMPEMNGIIATQEIRAMEITGELPQRPKIVCCTAHRSQEDIEKCIVAGMDDYMEKPISRVKLYDLVRGM